MVLKNELTMFMLFSLSNAAVAIFFLLMYLFSHYYVIFSEVVFTHMMYNSFGAEVSKSSSIFCFIVAGISASIYIYCFFYMGMNKQMKAFAGILMSFVVAMLILVVSDSVFVYMLGWDGLGVSSFLLVVYYSSLLATRSGLATFITNRLGDFFIIISFVLLLSDSFYLIEQMHMCKYQVNLMFFFILTTGAFTKSAQMPFSAWLPAAMAAPTPVSALVHSSTLVTAGMFILSKFLNFMDVVNNMSLYFCIMTIVLSAMAGLMATFETDFKKLVAMSTLSQMGLIGYVLFLKEKNISLFHIFSHATFKSLLFLVVGVFILFNLGFQDTRVKMSPMKMMKTPMILLICSSLSLMGFMFSSGFFSKDQIILLYGSSGISLFPYFVMIFSCTMTVCYTMKSFLILQNTMLNSSPFSSKMVTEKYLMPTSTLFFFTLIFGFCFFFMFNEMEYYTLEQINKIMGVFIIFMGLILTRVSWNPKLNKMNTPTTSNSSDLKIYFMQMSNLNWISNNFLSHKMKKDILFLVEPIWWNLWSEKINQYMAHEATNAPKASSLYFKNVVMMAYFFTCILLAISIIMMNIF